MDRLFAKRGLAAPPFVAPFCQWLAIAAGLLLSGLFVAPHLAAAEAAKGRTGVATGRDTGNFTELANQEKGSARTIPGKSKPARALVRPRPNLPVPESARREAASRIAASSLTTATASTTAEAVATPESSGQPPPPLTASFAALGDNGTAFNPDTQGAVGPNHLMVTLNSQVRVQNRSGGTLSTVSLESFWSGLGASNVFDPRILYDPYGQRWIFTAEADPSGVNPLLLIAVSQTSDPTGNWHRRSVDLNRVQAVYTDSPNVGFTKDWITVQADIFDTTDSLFVRSDVYVFNKADLYAGGAGIYSYFTIDDSSSAHAPAATYSPSLDTQYLVTVWNENTDGFGYLRIYSISGVVGAEVLTALDVYPSSDPWEYTSDALKFFPQLGSANKILAGDSRLANVVFRNSTLWTTHTIFLPVGSPTRSAVQWWEFSPGGGFQQDGILQGNVNFYAFPSIAVNRDNAMLLGYSLFASNQYPSAAYSYRSDVPDDPLNLLRPSTALKAGEAPYNVTTAAGFSLWGDWSATTVDPDNDTDLWTIQEYAATSGGLGAWGTWWGRVTPPVDLALSMTDSPDPVLAGTTLTYTLTVTNNRQARVDGVLVTNTLPAGVNFISAIPSQGSCSQAGGLVVCDLGRLEDAARATITMTVTPIGGPLITNTATVTARGPEITPGNNNASAVTTVDPSADLAVTVSDFPDPVAVGSNLTYVVTITNHGPSTARGLVVTNAMPFASTFVSASLSLGTFIRTNNLVIWTIGPLAVGVSPTITIVVRPTGAATITNRVTLRYTSIDLVPGNNTVVVTTLAGAPPTIQTIGNRTIAEDTFTSINFGVGDLETPVENLVVTARSSNEGIVPNANVILTPLGGSNWMMTLTPLPEQFGPTTITRTVTDEHGAATSSPFTLTVAAVNDVPTLDPITGFPAQLNEDPGTQMVNLSGIGSGAFNEIQPLTVTATSSDPAIIPNQQPNLVVGYTNGNSIGVVSFAPLANANGSVTIMVRVNDGGTSNNIVTRNFTVNINAVNDPPTLNPLSNLNINEDAPPQGVALRGLSGGPADESQAITIIATSDNPALIPDPGVVYSGGITGLLTFAPVPNTHGSALITVTLNDNAGSNNIAIQRFTVIVNEVNDPPTLNTNANLFVPENAGVQTVFLTGISSGAPDESQFLTVTASTTNSSLLANVMVNYQSPNSTATLTFTPVNNANGSGSITVTVRDDGASNNVINRTINVTVASVNNPPTLDFIGDRDIPEDAGLQTIILTGITEGAPNETAQNLTVTASSSDTSIIPHPTINYTNGSTTGVLRFTPVANAFGNAVITVMVNDGQSINSNIVRMFTVRVMSVNDLPTISAVANRTINEDTTTNLTFQVGDVETAPGVLSVVGTSSNQLLVPNSAIVINNPGGSSRVATITPAANQTGSATITLTVTDSDGGRTDEIFTLTVGAVNDPPTINPISSFPINEDAGLQTVLLSGLSGGPADELQTLTLSAISSNTAIIPTPTIVNHGNGTATLSFTPNANASGNVGITVTVRDSGTSNNVTRQSFTVMINPINDPPIISDIPPRTINEDTRFTLSFRVFDVETPAGSLRLEGQSSNEELISNADITFGGSGTNRNVTIRPLTNQFSSAAITITVTDSNNASVSTFFELIVNQVNDPPTISPLFNVLVRESTSTPPIPFTIGDVESPLSALTVSGSSSNPNLVPNSNFLFSNNGADWTVILTPLPNRNGLTTISIRVSDGELTRTNSFVLNVNDGPDISNITNRITNEDTPITIPFTIGDAETPAANLMVAASSSNPALVSTQSMGITFGGSGSNRTVTIRPLTNQFGSTFITLFVNDAQAITNSLTFELTVLSVNEVPAILDLSGRSTPEETPISVSFRVGDVETSATDLIATGNSSNQGLVPNANLSFDGSGSNRTVTVRPEPNLTGTAIITVFVVDTHGGIGSNTFQLTVNGVNDSPTISSLPALTINEDTPTGPLPLTVGDLETPAASLSMSGSAGNPSLISSINFGGSGVNRTVTISSAPNQSGTTMITLNVGDGTTFSTTSFQLTINPINDPPTLLPPGNLTLSENAGPQTVILRGLTGGPADESQALTVLSTTSNPGLISNLSVNYTPGNTNAPLTFTPVANMSGTGIVTVTVTDGPPPNNMVSQRFTVVVNSVSDPPRISAVTSRTILEDTFITVPFTVQDPDTAPLDLIMTASSTNPGLIANTNIFFDGSGTNRTVTLVPTRSASGAAVITLTVSDGTTSVSTNFTLNVTGANDPPTLDPIADVIRVAGNNLTITVNLTGITSGAGNESQTLTVTTSSSNTSLVPTPGVTYSSPANTGSLNFRVPNNASGSAIVTVTVSDGQASVSRTFGVYVRASGNAPPTISAIANRTIVENTSANISFTVNDATTAQSLLMVVGRSSNPDLLPNSSIVITGATSSRTLILTPLPNLAGTSTITVSATDTDFGSTNVSFVLTVTNANDRPTISAIADIVISEDSPSAAIAFTVADAETPAANLTVSGTSGNTALVPNTNIDFGGNGTNRALVIIPAANQTGSASITVTVNDGSASTSTNFTVTVTGVNDPPTITVMDYVMTEDSIGMVPFIVSDVDTAGVNLSVTATSSNPALVPDSALQAMGSTSNRTLIVTPLGNQFGTTTITITANDGSGGASLASFLLTVNSLNNLPTLDPFSNLTYARTSSTQVLNLTGIGSGAPDENQTLIVAASSSNIGLVPHPTVSYTSPNGTGLLTLTAAGISNGTATITVTVNDGQSQNNTVVQTFTVTVNALPTISNIPPQSTLEDTPTAAIPFTVGDVETPGALMVRATSSNQNLVPDQNIALDGTGADRTVSLTPAANQFGSTTIQIMVTDGSGAMASTSFLLVVASVQGNDPALLRISRGDNNTIVVSWPVSLTGFTLQSSTGTGEADAWAVSPGVPFVIGDRYHMTNTASGRTRFYRLVQGVGLTVTYSNNNIVIAWPFPSTGYVLESRDTLSASSNWTPVSGTPIQIGDQNTVTVSASGPAKFYRLRGP